MVIVCMLFVGIIASLVLSLSVKNLETMQSSINSTSNFYTAENVVDEVQTQLEELADRAVRKAYTEWLQRYTMTSADQQATLFKQLFTSELNDLINTEFLSYFAVGANPNDLFYKFDATNVEWLKTPSVSINADGTALTLKDISIAYLDNKGLTSTITTDLVFDLTYPGFKANTAKGKNLACANYIIIADEQITNNVTVTGSIKGSLYGGGYNTAETGSNKYTLDGILINAGSSLNIQADHVLSRSIIRLADNSKVTIKGANSDYDYTGTLSYSNIWATNLALSGSSSVTNPVKMNIQGNCYLADDLTLDAEGSSFSLKGTYYGYNTNNASAGLMDSNGVQLRTGTPEGSSAIVLNGKNSTLDLTEASTIWVAGKSFVSVPYKYGLGATSNNVAFQQGESISYRGLQAAYLLPGGCITGIGHNPMTDTEYQKLIDDAENYKVDITLSRKSGGIRLENYVQRDKPYRVAKVIYNSNTTMVYLYLNFQSSDKASQYFQEFQESYEELVDSRMTTLGDGAILFNPSALVNTGNVIGYEDGVVRAENSKYKYNDPTIENKQIELSASYSGLVTSLNENYAGASMNGFLTDSIVNMAKITSDVQSSVDLDYKVDETKYYLITGEDITIDTNSAGIIIAKGDVYIKNSASFTGLIIARGKVIIEGTANLKADNESISYLIQNHEEVEPYFFMGDSSSKGDGNNIFASDLINVRYENWHKN